MGWFKKLTGVSSKSIVQAGAAAAGAYVGGPQGAAAGYNLGGALTGDKNALNSLVSGAVGLGSDYLQSQINLQNQKELAKYNAEQQWILNQQAFDQNVNMWNMQNAYNTPVQQMQRLVQAGLNPNLIYGSGNVTGNTAGKAPEIQAPNFDTGAYHPVDTRIERAQLALAMESQYQQVQNQKIQNDLARQKLALAERASDRADVSLMLRNQKISRGLTNTVESDKQLKERQAQYDREYTENMRAWREKELQHRKGQNFISSKLTKYLGDSWYKKNPQPRRVLATRGVVYNYR